MRIKRKSWEWEVIAECINQSFAQLVSPIGNAVVKQKWAAVIVTHVADDLRRKVSAAHIQKGYRDESVFSIDFKNCEATCIIFLDAYLPRIEGDGAVSIETTWRNLIEEVTQKIVNL